MVEQEERVVAMVRGEGERQGGTSSSSQHGDHHLTSTITTTSTSNESRCGIADILILAWHYKYPVYSHLRPCVGTCGAEAKRSNGMHEGRNEGKGEWE